MSEFTNAETAAQFARWTKEHSLAAEREGWNMFDYDGMGLLQLECYSELGVFDGDDEALEHVRNRAEAGDGTARLALELEAYFQPIIERVREAVTERNATFGR
jgi:hypothetical protein